MNLELLNRVWKQIDSQPETWDQGIWFRVNSECGTQACVAGWSALLSGWEPVTGTCWDEFMTRGYTQRRTRVAARWELGLTSPQADWLFDSDRTYDDIKSFVDEANKEEA